MADVAVITPVRNGRTTLPALVASLGVQSADVQWVVVDDGSTDGTRDYLAGLTLPPGVELVLLSGGGVGPGPARNTALPLVDTPWVTFVDADDRLEPSALLCWTDAAVRLDADLLLVEQPAGVIGRRRARLGKRERVVARDDLWGGELLRPWGVYGKLFRRSLIAEVRFAASSEAEDLAFYVDAVLRARRVGVAPVMPRYVYDRPARSTLSVPLPDPLATLDTYVSVLGRLATAAPDHRALIRGASPVLDGLAVTLMRALRFAADDDEAARLQARAREGLRAVALTPGRMVGVYRRDRAVVAAGALCLAVPAGAARRFATAWVAAKPVVSRCRGLVRRPPAPDPRRRPERTAR